EPLDVHLVWPNHSAGHSPRLLQQRQGFIEKINSFVQHYNRHHRPLVWTATADSILEKITRLCSVISGTKDSRTSYRKTHISRIPVKTVNSLSRVLNHLTQLIEARAFQQQHEERHELEDWPVAERELCWPPPKELP